MKSPDDDFNRIIYGGLTVFIVSLLAAFAFGVWIGTRL